jgi:hypothetical protein
MFGPLLVGHVVAKERLCACLIGHSGPLLTAAKDIDISEATVLAKLDLKHDSDQLSSVELPGIETDALPGILGFELPVRSISVQLSYRSLPAVPFSGLDGVKT